jgi:hypothetical protein
MDVSLLLIRLLRTEELNLKGLHLRACNASYPTHVENLLWRISTLVIAASGFTIGIVVPLGDKHDLLDDFLDHKNFRIVFTLFLYAPLSSTWRQGVLSRRNFYKHQRIACGGISSTAADSVDSIYSPYTEISSYQWHIQTTCKLIKSVWPSFPWSVCSHRHRWRGQKQGRFLKDEGY